MAHNCISHFALPLMSGVWYKGKLMIEVLPHERCPLKIGIVVGKDVKFFKFAPVPAPLSFEDILNRSNYDVPDVVDDGMPLYFDELADALDGCV